MSDIGERIKELRSEAGITQLQLGKYAGCTGQVISNIEEDTHAHRQRFLTK